jgi:hypothetical protein
MSPVTHTLLHLALSVLGSVAGGWLGECVSKPEIAVSNPFTFSR